MKVPRWSAAVKAGMLKCIEPRDRTLGEGITEITFILVSSVSAF